MGVGLGAWWLYWERFNVAAMESGCRGVQGQADCPPSQSQAGKLENRRQRALPSTPGFASYLLCGLGKVQALQASASSSVK